jgi:trehalose synthase
VPTVGEALRERTPVVGSDGGGVPLQVRDGESGYPVDPEDYPAVADRVRALLEDPSRGERLVENGGASVRERFLLPRRFLDHLELVRESR